MKFWDSSAVVSLLVDEAATALFTRVYATDPDMFVWWATEVECASALARRAREQQDGSVLEALQRAHRDLDQFAQRWHEVAPGQEVRKVARRLLNTHSLGAADALQLAAVLVARGEQASSLEFVCADKQLIAAARLEGLTIATPDVAREPEESSYEIARRLGAIGSDSSRAQGVAARAKQAARQAIRAKHSGRKGERSTR